MSPAGCEPLKDACVASGGETDGEQPITIDIYDLCARPWQDNQDYAADETIVPRRPNGYALKARNTARSGPSEPRWTPRLGAIVYEGSMEWEVVEAAGNGLNEASDPITEITPDDGGLEITDIEITEQRQVQFTYVGVEPGVYGVKIGVLIDGLRRWLSQTVTVT